MITDLSDFEAVEYAIIGASDPREYFHKINDLNNPEQIKAWLFRWFNSYERLPALLSIKCWLDEKTLHNVLRDEWSDFDHITPYLSYLRELLGQHPIMDMMTEEERQAYNALPNIITVYRGCGPNNMRGASWTLDQSVAEKVLTVKRYAKPLLITARVRKDRVLAVKLNRNEQEIITFSTRRVSVEQLDVAVAA